MAQVEAILDLKRWGNGLGVRLPPVVARAAHLFVNQRVRVVVEAGLVIITPVACAGITLKQRLAMFDPARHGGEAMATKPLGVEI